MNYLEITRHIEQRIIKLLSLTENAKYYVLNHHNKFEETLNVFNQEVEVEKIWIESHKSILSTTPELTSYYYVILHLSKHPLIPIKQGDMLFYIHIKQFLLHEQLLKIKPSTS